MALGVARNTLNTVCYGLIVDRFDFWKVDLNKAQIVEELDRVCASSEFRSKPVMRRLLTYLVKEHIEGRTSQIKGFSIAVDVFEQGKDFDSDKSALVRNSAVRLRGLLNSYYLGEGQTDPVRIDVPKGGYAPTIAANDQRSAKAPGAGAESQATSVAVLPFSYLSGSRDYEYMASGFSQELSDALTRFDDLRVIGVSHQMGRDEGSTELLEEIRDKQIDFLINGVFKIEQDRGTVIVRLIKASNDQQIWKKSYGIDLSRESLFEVLEEISGKIASHVGGEYGRINQARLQALVHSKPQSLSEQDILLKFYHTHAVLTEEATIDYQESLVLALQSQPESPLLNALMGGTYHTIWCNEFSGAENALELLAHHAEKAYALNPNHQIVVGTLGAKCFSFDERHRFFTLMDRHGVRAANTPLRLGAWALWACYWGEWEQGMKLMHRVFENNIDLPGWIHGVPCMYQYRQRNYDDALVEANKVHVPGLFWGPALRCSVLGQLGRQAEAEREYDALLECRPDFPDTGRIMMGRIFKQPGLLELVLEGFEKMGVSLA